MHPILQRQLNRLGLDENTPPDAETWAAFIHKVDQTYISADKDRYLLERSLSISSREMQEEIKHRKMVEKENLELAIERERSDILSKFIEGALHEFRTPLSTIRLNLHMLESGVQAGYEGMVRAIAEQSDSILYLVENLALMSSLDNKLEVDFMPIDVHLILDTLFTKLHQQSEMNLHIERQFAPDLPLISGDTHCLSILFNELIENAYHHTPDNGTISVTTRQNDPYIEIVISDTGSGIRDTDLPHVFDRFFRGDKAHTTRGLGLGLSIATSIARHHHGCIEVKSEVGVGSTFTVYLPQT